MTAAAMAVVKSVGLKASSSGGSMITDVTNAAGVILVDRRLLEDGVGDIVAGLSGSGFSIILFINCLGMRFEGC